MPETPRRRMLDGIEVGDLVAVEFLDHSENNTELYRFDVYGRVEEKTGEKLVLVSWRHSPRSDLLPTNDSDPIDLENLKVFCISVGSITAVGKLRMYDVRENDDRRLDL